MLAGSPNFKKDDLTWFYFEVDAIKNWTEKLEYYCVSNVFENIYYYEACLEDI